MDLCKMISTRCLQTLKHSRSVNPYLFPQAIGSQCRHYSKSVEEQFIRPEVQEILKRVTGFDLEKIFAVHPTDVHPPKYELLTDKQLSDAKEQAELRGRQKLQMPPVMSHPVDEEEIISEEPEIENFDIEHPGAKYVFTDISLGVKRRMRTIVVREHDGTLRKADWEERNRILQVYFPQKGRMYSTPTMFMEESLESLLAEGKYCYILDRACVQFEPDDPNYIRVTQRTYESINSSHDFDELRSTRHFGPMAFYFGLNKQLDNLLTDCLQRDLLKDAADLVHLHLLLHPETKSSAESVDLNDALATVKFYIQHEAKNSGALERSLQGLVERTQAKESSAAGAS
ncbi:hypothetical protein CAPTEDRAFT_156720 [Capitella teleta]|uniref:28S ribosomal protein S22, mitochondrial n=1 Tax=Capitella teleta TaxID=283909 RepID=R7VAW2_CAPTE|nr:hypothetical protein CAPTEDRAFT_156720 [Capitella teleta]|eukprot:ELU15734.1 hypothetical protein CAPTEDRAFT_156720 [Capitella teleta]